MIDSDYLRDLERSHDELRAALVFAGRRLRQLRPGFAKDPHIEKLRELLRDARRVRRSAPRQARPQRAA